MNKKRRNKIIILIILLLFSYGLTHFKEAEITEFFWPLEVGKRFIYRIGEFEKYVTIKSILKEKSGDIRVETREEINAFGKAIEKKDVFMISIRKNVISRGEKKEEVILLKGPIKKGIKWKTNFYKGSFDISNQKGKFKEKLKKREGVCQIEKVQSEEILNSIQNCVIVLCTNEENKDAGFEVFFCKNIGYAGFKLFGSDEWIERLIDVR